MADRPWVTPEEVREYSGVEAVQSRTDIQLGVDIARAEQYVITYTHNTFEGCESLPQPVKTAVLILSERYAHGAVVSARGVKSETFDDYSYTAADTISSVEDLNLAALLDDFVLSAANKSVTMRLRKL